MLPTVCSFVLLDKITSEAVIVAGRDERCLGKHVPALKPSVHALGGTSGATASRHGCCLAMALQKMRVCFPESAPCRIAVIAPSVGWLLRPVHKPAYELRG